MGRYGHPLHFEPYLHANIRLVHLGFTEIDVVEGF